MTTGITQVFTPDFAETPFQLATVERWVLAHRSGRENKFIAKSWWNRAAGFQQRLQMRFGCLLKP